MLAVNLLLKMLQASTSKKMYQLFKSKLVASVHALNVSLVLARKRNKFKFFLKNQ